MDLFVSELEPTYFSYQNLAGTKNELSYIDAIFWVIPNKRHLYSGYWLGEIQEPNPLPASEEGAYDCISFKCISL